MFDPADNRVAPGATETTAFTISVSDGVASAVTDNSTTVLSTSVNDAPVLDSTKVVSLVAENEDAGAPVNGQAVGTAIESIVDFATPAGEVDNVIDPDPNALLGIVITAVDTANGVWWYSLGNGGIWPSMGSVADNCALLAGRPAHLFPASRTSTDRCRRPFCSGPGIEPAAATAASWCQR